MEVDEVFLTTSKFSAHAAKECEWIHKPYIVQPVIKDHQR
jgi:hypothetical protein